MHWSNSDIQLFMDGIGDMIKQENPEV